MLMVVNKIDVKGEKELNREITRLVKFIKKPKEAYRDGSIEAKKDIQVHFIQERGPHRSWKKSQRVKKFGGNTLRKTGDMARAVQPFHSEKEGGAGIIKKQAKVHNFGLTIKHPGTTNGFGRGIKIPAHSIKMPKREFMFISKGAANRIADRFLVLIKRQVRA